LRINRDLIHAVLTHPEALQEKPLVEVQINIALGLNAVNAWKQGRSPTSTSIHNTRLGYANATAIVVNCFCCISNSGRGIGKGGLNSKAPIERAAGLVRNLGRGREIHRGLDSPDRSSADGQRSHTHADGG
jgi:hypothetical protein